jgi:hypothetical protein
MLAKQTLYCLNHTSTPFFSGYFGDGVAQTIYPELAKNCNPLDLSLPSSWDYRREPPVHSLEGSLLPFFSRVPAGIQRPRTDSGPDLAEAREGQ